MINGEHRMNLFPRALLFCLLLASQASLAQIYKYIDKDGNITYSDTPPIEKQDMEPADLPDIIVQPSVQVPDRAQGPEKQGRDIQISISSPTHGATILGSASSFGVAASVNKKLRPNESVRLLVNGTPLASASAKTLNWTVTDLIRGEYLLSAEILDGSQQVIATSKTVQVFVKRNIAR